jgi:hypothetical protein
MKTNVLACLIFSSTMFSGQLFAQSKKTLKSEKDELQHQIVSLKRDNATLEKLSKDKQTELDAMRADLQARVMEVERLRLDSATLAYEYGRLKEDYETYKLQSAPLSVKPSTECGTDMTLVPNTTYTLDFKPVHSKGWGVQVFAFDDFCIALEKAKEFSRSYHMYKTYIRVKHVNGVTKYAVVYGTLKHKAEAQTYCDGFKKKVRGTEFQNAFLIHHAEPTRSNQ